MTCSLVWTSSFTKKNNYTKEVFVDGYRQKPLPVKKAHYTKCLLVMHFKPYVNVATFYKLEELIQYLNS